MDVHFHQEWTLILRGKWLFPLYCDVLHTYKNKNHTKRREPEYKCDIFAISYNFHFINPRYSQRPQSMRQAQHQQWYEFGLSAIDAAFQPSQQDKPL